MKASTGVLFFLEGIVKEFTLTLARSLLDGDRFWWLLAWSDPLSRGKCIAGQAGLEEEAIKEASAMPYIALPMPTP